MENSAQDGSRLGGTVSSVFAHPRVHRQISALYYREGEHCDPVMWIETDHNGMVNLDYVKRIDLAGDIPKNTFGVYLFDMQGNTYPIVDLSRFRNIGVLEGKETDRDIHTAVYAFYTIVKRLIATKKEQEVLTIETVYREFAAEWYAEQKQETVPSAGKEEPEERAAPVEGEEAAGSEEQPVEETAKVHAFSDMKLLLDAYSEGYTLKFQRKPSLRYEKEGKIAVELIKMYPLDKLRKMLAWYFESDEEFITTANYDMKTFKAILERTRKTGNSEDE